MNVRIRPIEKPPPTISLRPDERLLHRSLKVIRSLKNAVAGTAAATKNGAAMPQIRFAVKTVSL
jgi:hypothetical protein